MRDFVKMHGLGNDFIVFDVRTQPLDLSEDQIQALSNRKTGIGCDQLILIEPSDKADVFMRIYNADGSQVEACGNATRCVAALVMAEQGSKACSIDTVAGILTAEAADDQMVTVQMPVPKLEWDQIPLDYPQDTLSVLTDYAGRGDEFPAGIAVNVGNPHIVTFVYDAEAVDLERVGPEMEHDRMFPQKINVEFANLTEDGAIRMRVWERGTGITMACGTGACATLVAAVRAGYVMDEAEIILDGGSLHISWAGEGHPVFMTGAAETAFIGRVEI